MADKRLRTKQELKRLFRNLNRKGISDDMMNILIDTLWRDRVVNRTSGFYFAGGEDAVIAFDNTTRTFSIQPFDPEIANFDARFLFYSYTNRPVLHRKFNQEAIVLPNEEGLYVIYYAPNEEEKTYILTAAKNPTTDQLQDIYEKEIVVSFIYWDATNQQALTFGEDRHGSEWNPQLHWYLHNAFHGRRTPGGLNVTGMQINEDGSSDAHAQFSVTPGGFSHDDIAIAVDAAAGGTAAIPVLYFSGVGNYPRFSTQAGFQVLNSGRVVYNQNSESLTQCTDGWYVAYHVFATNDRLDGQQIISVAGQNQYEKLAEAFAQVQNEVNTIYGLAPQQGLCYLGSVIFQTSDAYTNAVKARIAGFSGDEEHPAVSIAPGSEVYLRINEKQELEFDPSLLSGGHNPVTIAADSQGILGITETQELSIDTSGLGGGTSSVNGETPNGIIDGINTTFTLANLPNPYTIRVYKQGVRQLPGTDYTINGTTLELTEAPAVGVTILVFYDKFDGDALLPIAGEIPAGAIDGANTTFVLNNIPVGAIDVYRNGILLDPANDYTYENNTIELTEAPYTGENIVIDYTTATQPSGATYNEIPAGVVDGINTDYIITDIALTVIVFRNGVRQLQNTHFTFSDDTISMTNPLYPGEWLLVDSTH